MNGLPPHLFRRGNMTPEEELQQAQLEFQHEQQQPASYGQGFENLASGIALGHKRREYNESRQPHERQASGLQRIAEALAGQQAPWQFPGAPQQGGGNAPAPQFDIGSLFSLFGGKRPTGGGLY